MLLVGALTLMGCMGTTSTGPSPTTSKTSPSSALPPPARPQTINLRVMTFNIEYGGEGVDFASVSKAITAADRQTIV